MNQICALIISLGLFLPVAVSAPAPWQTSNPSIDQLKSPDAKIRAKAARDFGKLGDSSFIPALKAALIDPDVRVRREVVLALAALHNQAALEPLAGAARDDDRDIRSLAIQSMVGYYSGE